MIKLGYEMQFRLVRLRNRVRLLGVEMHLRLVVSRLTICARRRRLGCSVVCYHRYDFAGSVQLQISLSTRVSLVSTAPQIPPTDRFTPGDAREESRQQTKDAH